MAIMGGSAFGALVRPRVKRRGCRACDIRSNHDVLKATETPES